MKTLRLLLIGLVLLGAVPAVGENIYPILLSQQDLQTLLIISANDIQTMKNDIRTLTQTIETMIHTMEIQQEEIHRLRMGYR